MDFDDLLAKEIAKKKQKVLVQKKAKEESRKISNGGSFEKGRISTNDGLITTEDSTEEQTKESRKRKEQEQNEAEGEDEDEQQKAREKAKRQKLVERLKAAKAKANGDSHVTQTTGNLDTRTPEEVKKKLKELGEPETVAENESDDDRRKRLQVIEKQLAKMEQLRKEQQEEEDVEFAIKPEDINSDPNKVYIQIRAYLKYLLVAWEDVLEKRRLSALNADTTGHKKDAKSQELDDEIVAKTSAKIYDEVKVNLEPLFDLLRSKTLPKEIFPTLATLITYLQQKKFTEAETTYISLSIGHSAWPVGIVAVGIHERSALSKTAGINAGAKDVANIVKDGNSRRWITSIKRLITFSQGCL